MPKLGSTVITNCTPVSHDIKGEGCGEGDTSSVGKVDDIWCEKTGSMSLIEGLMRKHFGQTLAGMCLPL